jgi:hypothetical protein
LVNIFLVPPKIDSSKTNQILPSFNDNNNNAYNSDDTNKSTSYNNNNNGNLNRTEMKS